MNVQRIFSVKCVFFSKSGSREEEFIFVCDPVYTVKCEVCM